MQEEAGRIVETPIEARAGFLDRPTLVVLLSLAALYIGFLRGKPPQLAASSSFIQDQ